MKKKATKETAQVQFMPGYKGFNRGMTCRGFQYKEGETYTHNGTAAACNSGFHFCTNPLDVFNYYAPGESVFHSVTGSGQLDLEHEDDTKVASTEIHIGASLSLHDMISASISFFFSRKYDSTGSKHSEGRNSASSATGDSSASSATGDSSASSATGYSSASSATGDSSASSAIGLASAAVATGLSSKAMAGKYGCIALAWWNEEEDRSEMRCAEIGCGDGSDGKLKAEVWYRLNEQGEFVEVA